MTTFCQLCGASQWVRLTPDGWSARGYSYWRCDACQLGQLRSPVELPDPAEFYDSGYFCDGGARAGYADYVADEELHRSTARRRLRRAADAGADGGLLVDLGSAVGYLPDEARRLGYDAVGVEISQWAADRARDRGLRVEKDLAGLSDLAGRVDIVTMFQVLEHMPEPWAALRQAQALLRPGGILICETWDAGSRTARLFGARWQQLSAPSVLWLFDPSSGRRMVEDAGLEAVSWRRTGKTVSLATALGQAVAGGRAVAAAQPLTSKVPIPYFLDDLVTFVARRPG